MKKKNRRLAVPFQLYNGLIFFFELVFADSAVRAYPIFGYIFELGSRGYAVIRIALRFVVYISAYLAYILIHFCCPPWFNISETAVLMRLSFGPVSFFDDRFIHIFKD